MTSISGKLSARSSEKCQGDTILLSLHVKAITLRPWMIKYLGQQSLKLSWEIDEMEECASHDYGGERQAQSADNITKKESKPFKLQKSKASNVDTVFILVQTLHMGAKRTIVNNVNLNIHLVIDNSKNYKLASAVCSFSDLALKPQLHMHSLRLKNEHGSFFGCIDICYVSQQRWVKVKKCKLSLLYGHISCEVKSVVETSAGFADSTLDIRPHSEDIQESAESEGTPSFNTSDASADDYIMIFWNSTSTCFVKNNPEDVQLQLMYNFITSPFLENRIKLGNMEYPDQSVTYGTDCTTGEVVRPYAQELVSEASSDFVFIPTSVDGDYTNSSMEYVSKYCNEMGPKYDDSLEITPNSIYSGADDVNDAEYQNSPNMDSMKFYDLLSRQNDCIQSILTKQLSIPPPNYAESVYIRRTYSEDLLLNDDNDYSNVDRESISILSDCLDNFQGCIPGTDPESKRDESDRHELSAKTKIVDGNNTKSDLRDKVADEPPNFIAESVYSYVDVPPKAGFEKTAYLNCINVSTSAINKLASDDINAVLRTDHSHVPMGITPDIPVPESANECVIFTLDSPKGTIEYEDPDYTPPKFFSEEVKRSTKVMLESNLSTADASSIDATIFPAASYRTCSINNFYMDDHIKAVDNTLEPTDEANTSVNRYYGWEQNNGNSAPCHDRWLMEGFLSGTSCGISGEYTKRIVDTTPILEFGLSIYEALASDLRSFSTLDIERDVAAKWDYITKEALNDARALRSQKSTLSNDIFFSFFLKYMNCYAFKGVPAIIFLEGIVQKHLPNITERSKIPEDCIVKFVDMALEVLISKLQVMCQNFESDPGECSQGLFGPADVHTTQDTFNNTPSECRDMGMLENSTTSSQPLYHEQFGSASTYDAFSIRTSVEDFDTDSEFNLHTDKHMAFQKIINSMYQEIDSIDARRLVYISRLQSKPMKKRICPLGMAAIKLALYSIFCGRRKLQTGNGQAVRM